MLALIAAQAADAITYLLLPPGAEANPLWAAQPVPEALLAKALVLLMVLLAGALLAVNGHPRLRDFLWQFGALAGAFGFGGNVSALLGGS